MDESILDKNFDAGLHVNIIQDEDLAQLSDTSQELEAHIAKLESDLQTVISKINTVQSSLNSLEITEGELDKYQTEKLDVAEKEVYQGVSYDIDIFDHGKKLADSDKEDFFSQYLEL